MVDKSAVRMEYLQCCDWMTMRAIRFVPTNNEEIDRVLKLSVRYIISCGIPHRLLIVLSPRIREIQLTVGPVLSPVNCLQ